MKRRGTRWNGEGPEGMKRDLMEWRGTTCLEPRRTTSPSRSVPLHPVPSLSMPSHPSPRSTPSSPSPALRPVQARNHESEVTGDHVEGRGDQILYFKCGVRYVYKPIFYRVRSILTSQGQTVRSRKKMVVILELRVPRAVCMQILSEIITRI